MESNCSRLYFKCGIVFFKIEKILWLFFVCVGIHVFFISHQNFQNKLGHTYGKSLFRLKLCLHYTYSLKFCLQKRLDHVQNMIILEKQLYKMCPYCDIDYNIIVSSDRHLFCCIFDKSEGKFFTILNRKNHSQYEKIHAAQKNINIIVFCKAQHYT